MQSRSASSLDLRELSKSFSLRGGRNVVAVSDFSLHIEPGEFVTFLGPSGCGKTTVLRMLAGLEHPDTGDVLLDGRSIRALPAYRRHVGMVFQNYALFPHLTVFENVAYSLRVRKRPLERVRSDVPAALKTVGLEDLAARLPGQLSGGQQQRVALARALVMQPDLLLFDEPLSNLDAKLRVQVRAELRRLQKQLGTTSIYVTHDQDEAMSLSDRIVVMNGGRVEQVGTPEEIYARPASLFVAGFVGQVNVLPGRVVAREHGRVWIEALGRRVAVADDRCPSDDVLVLIRPEGIRLTVPGADASDVGTIEELEYRGDRIEYRVRIGAAILIVVEPSLQRLEHVRLHERVGWQILEQTVHLIPASRNDPAAHEAASSPHAARSALSPMS